MHAARAWLVRTTSVQPWPCYSLFAIALLLHVPSFLIAQADEPVCDKPFDASFEADYPLEKEMPKELLQRYMFAEMVFFSNHGPGICW